MNHTNKVYNIHGGGELSELYLCVGWGEEKEKYSSEPTLDTMEAQQVYSCPGDP